MSDRVPLLEKALTILEIIGSDSNPLTINQIAKLSGIPLSSLYRVMNTLTELGFVNKDPITRTYSLGLKLLYLGNQVKRQLPLIKVVRPFLEELTEKTGETSNLVMEEIYVFLFSRNLYKFLLDRRKNLWLTKLLVFR